MSNAQHLFEKEVAKKLSDLDKRIQTAANDMRTTRIELDTFIKGRGLSPDYPGPPPIAAPTSPEASSQQPLQPNSNISISKDIPPRAEHAGSRLVAFMRSIIMKCLNKQASAPFPSRPIYPGRPGEITQRLNDLEKRLHDLGSRPVACLVESLKVAASLEANSLCTACKTRFGVIGAFIQQINRSLKYVNRQVDFEGLSIMAEYHVARKNIGGENSNDSKRLEGQIESLSASTGKASGLRQLKDQTDSLDSLSTFLSKQLKDFEKDWKSP